MESYGLLGIFQQPLINAKQDLAKAKEDYRVNTKRVELDTEFSLKELHLSLQKNKSIAMNDSGYSQTFDELEDLKSKKKEVEQELKELESNLSYKRNTIYLKEMQLKIIPANIKKREYVGELSEIEKKENSLLKEIPNLKKTQSQSENDQTIEINIIQEQMIRVQESCDRLNMLIEKKEKEAEEKLLGFKSLHEENIGSYEFTKNDINSKKSSLLEEMGKSLESRKSEIEQIYRSAIAEAHTNLTKGPEQIKVFEVDYRFLSGICTTDVVRNEVPQEVIPDSKEVLQDIKEVLQDIKEIPQEIKEVPQDVKDVIHDVKEFPQYIKDVPQDVKDFPQDINKVINDEMTYLQFINEHGVDSLKKVPQEILKDHFCSSFLDFVYQSNKGSKEITTDHANEIRILQVRLGAIDDVVRERNWNLYRT